MWVLTSDLCSGTGCACPVSIAGPCVEEATRIDPCPGFVTEAPPVGEVSIDRRKPMYWLVGPESDRTLIAVPGTFTEDDMRRYGYENPNGPCPNPDDCFDEAIEEIA
jgi:hypothetical protein